MASSVTVPGKFARLPSSGASTRVSATTPEKRVEAIPRARRIIASWASWRNRKHSGGVNPALFCRVPQACPERAKRVSPCHPERAERAEGSMECFECALTHFSTDPSTHSLRSLPRDDTIKGATRLRADGVPPPVLFQSRAPFLCHPERAERPSSCHSDRGSVASERRNLWSGQKRLASSRFGFAKESDAGLIDPSARTRWPSVGMT